MVKRFPVVRFQDEEKLNNWDTAYWIEVSQHGAYYMYILSNMYIQGIIRPS